jgi:hypothetical protein
MSSRSGGARRGGSRPSRAALQRSLDAYEGAMRYSATPQAYVFDAQSGARLFSPAVTAQGIEVHGPAQTLRLTDNVLSRNHPNGQGITLEEARFAADHGLSELRVVTPDARYRLYMLPRGADGWNGTLFQRQIQPAYDRALAQAAQEIRQDVWRGAVPVEQADTALADLVWRRVAQSVPGLEYRNEGWTEAATRASTQAARGRTPEQMLAGSSRARERNADAAARALQQLMEQQRREQQ